MAGPGGMGGCPAGTRETVAGRRNAGRLSLAEPGAPAVGWALSLVKALSLGKALSPAAAPSADGTAPMGRRAGPRGVGKSDACDITSPFHDEHEMGDQRLRRDADVVARRQDTRR